MLPRARRRTRRPADEGRRRPAGRRWRTASFAPAAAVALLVAPLAAQTTGTLDLGVSAVRYDQFLGSATAFFAPAIHHDTPNLSVGAQATWLLFESGRDILQGTGAVAWISPPVGGLRAELSGSVGLARYTDEPAFGHVLARTRVHYHGARSGVWLGGATGGSFGRSGEIPLEITIGGWTVQERVALVGTITQSALSGGSYTDVVGAARYSAAAVSIDALIGTRPSGSLADDIDDGLFGEVGMSVALNERLNLAASAGRTPTDPIRGLLASEFLEVGLRVDIFGAAPGTIPAVTRAVARSAEILAASPDASRARLDVVPGTLSTMLRVSLAGATSVEIMGDFTDWEPVLLARAGPGVWQVQLPIPPGVHRMNIRVDGGPWQVPLGTRLEETEFGGAVGILYVP